MNFITHLPRLAYDRQPENLNRWSRIRNAPPSSRLRSGPSVQPSGLGNRTALFTTTSWAPQRPLDHRQQENFTHDDRDGAFRRVIIDIIDALSQQVPTLEFHVARNGVFLNPARSDRPDGVLMPGMVLLQLSIDVDGKFSEVAAKR
jgi:hypothetical protein